MVAAFAALSLASCKKEDLNPIPQTVLSNAVAFGTPERIQQQVFGVYNATKSGQLLGGRALVYNDVRGEDWVNITGNGVTALGVWNFSLVSSDNQVEGLWAAGYAAINRANVVVDGIDKNSNVISAALANQYKAEARFNRALSYFYLVTLYGRRPFTADNGASPGIPLRLTPNVGNVTEMKDVARSSVAEIYTQILSDLNFAEQNLPLNYSGGDSVVARAHRNAAIAFKTRVYLNMGRYTDVITEANKIVSAAAPFMAASGRPHALAPNILSVFRANYLTTESIFSFPMSQNSPPGTQNGLALYHNAEFALNTAPTGSGIWVNPQFTATDARRTNFTGGNATTVRYTKFNDDNNNYVPIIRYAEVLLNLAEALARTGTGVDARALALLNAVHGRSDATVLAPTTQADLIQAILTERRIELLGEGVRSLDIMRQGLPFPAKGSVSAVPPSSVSYVWPIPASELLYNKLITPNL